MKKMYKLYFVMASAGLLTLGTAGSALAFHGGGVAHCDGCHTMHNSMDGGTAVSHGHGAGGTVGTAANAFLTIGTDASSTCLNCHNGAGSYHVMSTDGSNYGTGGDFFWLLQDVPLPRGGISLGDNHGHNTVAADWNIAQDATLTSGPSDGTVTYQASWLGCNSCHDPHGKKDNGTNPGPIAGSGSYGAANPDPGNTVLGNFRLLGGIGYDGGAQASGIAFSAGDPVAVANNGNESDILHTDFGSGMSEWCANCHSGFTADGSTAHRHPASDDAHLNGFGSVYNAYVATGELTGTNADSYDRLVPFERGVGDADNDGEPDSLGATAGALAVDNTAGPDTSSNVMCLTCHRAHASAFDNIGRWDFGEEILPDTLALGETYGIHMYQGEDIGTRYNAYQRSLCNKCHLQD